MKKFSLLFLTTIFSLTSVKASHLLGGEIGWTCLSNGSYVFHMSVLRDCTGIPFSYQNEAISVVGSPLPGMSSIIVKPDMVRWQAANNGDTSPECTSQYGMQYSCANSDPGTVQRFFYLSDTIQLTGVPPNGGWEFFWEAPCCRPGNLTNVNASGSLLLRAAMFANANNDSVDTCYDSSPNFTNLPTLSVCRGQELNYNHFALDEEDDPLVFSWGQPINSPISNPMPLPYKAGYSSTNPTPDTNIDATNKASTLNSSSGSVNFLINNGVGADRYLKVLKVAAWRDGVKISEVNREFLIAVLDCPPLPSGQVNVAPEVSMSNITKDNDGVYRDTIVAGTSLDYLIILRDTASNGVGNGLQQITLLPFGRAFSLDFADSSNCRNLSDTSCAFLDPAPMLNSSAAPPRLELSGLFSFSTRFKWETDCNHLSSNGGAKTHYFSLRHFDDHCPIQGTNYQDFEIHVVPSTQPCNLLTGIEENSNSSFENNMSVYPNPTNEQLTVRLNKREDRISILIRNIHGQVTDQLTFKNQQSFNLNLQGSPGVYFIEMINGEGEKANLKVIKQ